RRRHTNSNRDWSSDVCSSDLSSRNGRPASMGKRPDVRVTTKRSSGTLRINTRTGFVYVDYAHARRLADLIHDRMDDIEQEQQDRSEERRIGNGRKARERGRAP